MLESIFGTSEAVATAISLPTALLTVLVSFAVGIMISLTYMKTSARESYSQNFALTMVLTPAVISVIILLIGSNIARAFSLAGAFSIIRFRSAPGEPRDIAFVLFTMAAGLAAGTGFYGYALLFTVLMCGVMIVLHVTKFGRRNTGMQLLKINVPENLNYEGVFDEVLDKYSDSYELRKIKTTDLGSLYQLVYSISLRDDMSRKEFMDTLRCRNGNLNITLSMAQEPSY
jgi:uncharacterized protein DUF4956